MRSNYIQPRHLGRLSPLILAAAAIFPAASFAADGTATNAQLEERIRLLERTLELSAEEAAAAKKEAPVVTAGDKGFGFKSANGQYEIKFSALAQIDGRYFIDDAGAFKDGFIARRLRPTIQGSLGKLVSFRFTPEFAGQNGVGDGGAYSSIVDAYFDLKFSPYASLRIGKQKGPLGLERLQSGGNIELIERGLPTELVTNRDLGFSLYGEAFKSTLSYTFGIFNGTADGRDVSLADDGQKEFEGRIFFEPFKNDYGFFRGLGVGIAGSTDVETGSDNNVLSRYRTPGQNQFFSYSPATAAVPASGSTQAVAATTAAAASGVHYRYVPQAYFYKGNIGVLAEYVVSAQNLVRANNFQEVRNDAYSVEASYVLTGEDASYRGIKPGHPYTVGGEGWGALEVVLRYGSLDIDNNAFIGTADTRLASIQTNASKANAIGVGANWVLTQNAKITVDYNQTNFDGGALPAAGGDRRTEKALFSRLTVQY